MLLLQALEDSSKWESIVQTLRVPNWNQVCNVLGNSDVPDQLATTHTSSIGTWTSLDAGPGATSLRVCVEWMQMQLKRESKSNFSF